MGLIDEWAGRFFQELDYEREAASAATIAAQMADLPGITTPGVLPELSSHTVLTTAWVEGPPSAGWRRTAAPVLLVLSIVFGTRAAQDSTILLERAMIPLREFLVCFVGRSAGGVGVPHVSWAGLSCSANRG